MIANGSGNRSEKAGMHPACDPRVIENLRFMNEFFKARFAVLDADEETHQFIMKHEEFDEVDKLCQA